MPGSCTLKRDAPNATARKLANRSELSLCQCNKAYGSKGMPASTCVTMNMVAGQPRKRPCCPGILQTRLHQFRILLEGSFAGFRLFIRAESTLWRSSASSAPFGTFLGPTKSLDIDIFDQPLIRGIPNNP